MPKKRTDTPSLVELHLADSFRVLRESKTWTQKRMGEELAAEKDRHFEQDGCACAFNTVGDWERCDSLPDAKVVYCYEKIFRLPPGYLLQLLRRARVARYGPKAHGAPDGITEEQLRPFREHTLEMYRRDLQKLNTACDALASKRSRVRVRTRLLARVGTFLDDNSSASGAAPAMSNDHTDGAAHPPAQRRDHDSSCVSHGRHRDQPRSDSQLDRIAGRLCQLATRHGPAIGGYGHTRHTLSRFADITWAIDRRLDAGDPCAVDAVVAMAGCAFMYGVSLKRFERAAAAAADDDDRAGVWNAIGVSALGASDPTYAEECFNRALGLCSPGTRRWATAVLGFVEVQLRWHNSGHPGLVDAAQAQFEELADCVGVGHCLLVRAVLAVRHDDFDAAERHALEAAQHYFNRDRLGELNCVKVLADIAALCNRDDDALAFYELALSGYEALGYVLGCANARRGLGKVHLARGDNELAQEEVAAAETLYKQVRNELGQAHCLAAGAVLASRGGAELDRVRVQIQDAQWLYAKVRCRRGQEICVSRIGALATGGSPDDDSLVLRRLDLSAPDDNG